MSIEYSQQSPFAGADDPFEPGEPDVEGAPFTNEAADAIDLAIVALRDAFESLEGFEVDLGVSDTHIQVRYSSEDEWEDLVSLSALQGPAGDAPDLDMRVEEGWLEWRASEEDDWVQLVEITGATGGVASVGSSSPITSSGGSDPVIGIQPASSSGRGSMSSSHYAKLEEVDEEATANSSDSQLRDRSTHTGTQPISSVSGLQTELNQKANTGHSHEGVGPVLWEDIEDVPSTFPPGVHGNEAHDVDFATENYVDDAVDDLTDVAEVHAELAKLTVVYDEGWPSRPSVPETVQVTWRKMDPSEPDPPTGSGGMGPIDVALFEDDSE